VSNARDAIDQAARGSFDLAFVDLRLGSSLGSDLIPDLLAQSPWMRVVIITAHGSIDSAVETMKRGAADYLTKPFTPAQVRLVTERVLQFRALEQKVAAWRGSWRSPRPRRTWRATARDAAGDSPRPPDGREWDDDPPARRERTGKGVVARAIHAGAIARPSRSPPCPARPCLPSYWKRAVRARQGGVYGRRA